MLGNLEITPSASVLETYDDNLTYTHTSPISDEYTQLIFGLGVTQQGKTESFSINGNVDQELFVKNHGFDNTAENFNANFQDELSEYGRIKATDTFSNSEDPTTFTQAFGRTAGRYGVLDNRVDVLYSHDMTEQLTYNLRYSQEYTDFTQNTSPNTYLNIGGAGLDYAFDSANILSLNYNFDRRDFATGPYSITNEVAPNLRHFFTKQLYLDLSSGVDFLESFNGKDYVKPLYVATLTDDFDQNTSASLSYQQEYITDSYTEDLFNIWEVVGSLTKQLTNKLGVVFSGFWGKGTYLALGGNQGLTGVSIKLNYDLTKTISLNTGYSYSEETSNIGLNAYTKNTVFFGATIKF